MASELQQLIQEQILVLSESEMESLYRFMQTLRQHNATTGSSRPISVIAEELSSKVPYEEWAELPRDGAENHDHYLYGGPKKSR